MKTSVFFGIAILSLLAGGVHAQQAFSKIDKATVSDFQKRAKRYVERREDISRGLKKPPDEATPQQIQVFKTELQRRVIADRVNAKPGDVFTQQISRLLKETIAKEFKGWERSELRKTVLEADTKVPLKVNTIYPASKELVEMSPALLIALPQIPKELRYRFVGRSLAILDRDSSLIVDFMRDALP